MKKLCSLPVPALPGPMRASVWKGPSATRCQQHGADGLSEERLRKNLIYTNNLIKCGGLAAHEGKVGKKPKQTKAEKHLV